MHWAGMALSETRSARCLFFFHIFSCTNTLAEFCALFFVLHDGGLWEKPHRH